MHIYVIWLFYNCRAPDYSSGSSSSYQQESEYDENNKKLSPSAHTMQMFQMSQQKAKQKIENNNKSFTCTECGKGLARKDKLVSKSMCCCVGFFH